MRLAYTVTAQKGDSLCSIAIREGFSNCDALLKTAGNEAFANREVRQGDTVTIPSGLDNMVFGSLATGRRWTVRWVRYPVPQIRLLRGGNALSTEWSQPLTELKISNYVTAYTDRAARKAMPTGRRYDADAYADPNVFQVVVWDPYPWTTDRTAKLEALRPTYDGGRKVTGHQYFPALERNRRSLQVTLSRDGRLMTNAYFRSAYIRLVADAADAQALPAQTLLVTDLAADPQMEILDQNVRATYPISGCKRNDAYRCVASIEVPLTRGKFVRLAVRVLRPNASGQVGQGVGGGDDDGHVQRGHVQARIDTFCRQIWAQAQIMFDVVRLETVDYPSHMLTVGEVADQEGNDESVEDYVKKTGKAASGHVPNGLNRGAVGFTIDVDYFGNGVNSHHVIAPVTIPAGWSPLTTAGRIKIAIEEAQIPNLTAELSSNPKVPGLDRGSVDLLLKTPAGSRATISALTPFQAQDSDQLVRIVDSSVSPLVIWNDVDRNHIGSPYQRNIAKCLDTGDLHVIDLYVVGAMGANGQTIPETNRLAQEFSPRAALKSTIFLRSVAASDNTASLPYTMPHEIGHVLIDCGGHDDHDFGCLMNTGTGADTKRLPDFPPTRPNWQVTQVVNYERQGIDGYLGNRLQGLNTMAEVRRVAAPFLHDDRA